VTTFCCVKCDKEIRQCNNVSCKCKLKTMVIQNLEDETGGFCNSLGVFRNPHKRLVR